MNAIVVIETLTPAVVFAPGGVDDILARLKAEVLAEVTDISTEKGRKAVAALAYKVARSKTALDDMGKALTADLKAQTGAIDAERKRIRDELDALKDQVRKPLTDFEDAEKARIAAHEAALAEIGRMTQSIVGLSAAEIRKIRDPLLDTDTRDWQEFAARAAAITANTLVVLGGAIGDADRRESQAAELARLRAAEAERQAAVDKAEAERVAKEREDRAAAQAKADAEAKAAVVIAEANAREERAELARQKAEIAAKEAAERAEAEKVSAAEKAASDKKAAVAAALAKAAADEAKIKEDAAERQANIEHRRSVHRAIMNVFLEIGIDHDKAKLAIQKMTNGGIPNVLIKY